MREQRSEVRGWESEVRSPRSEVRGQDGARGFLEPGRPRPADGNSPRRGRRVSMKSGFTLIEVLAAMAVLVILILALTRMFAESAGIVRRGTTALMRNSTIETVLETILKDTESMVVNERLPCYIRADVTDPGGFGFDEAWFVTTSGDQDDDRAYQLRRYYVRETIGTNNLGLAYKRFQLFRDVWILAVADDNNVDVLENNRRWWETASSWGTESYMLADNVVRFDIYCLGWDGEDWMAGHSGLHVFDSTMGPLSLPLAERERYRYTPPASFDIYMQITSPEAAVEGGMALVGGLGAPIEQKARALMIRESATILGRATPLMGAAQLHHPTKHYADP
jgi:prepilin-type N-terminal cleavage/methylation domain-containing protein